MEFIAIAFLGLLIAIAIGLIVNKNRKERAKESLRQVQERERQDTIRADLAAAKAAEEARPKTEDHLAPKTDLRSANEAVAKAKAASHPAVGGGSTPSTPPNNSYYGKQPRVPRVTDTDPSNAAFLALIAAQQHEAQLLSNGGVIDDNGKPVEDRLSPEDEQKLEEAYNNLVADSKTEESKAVEQPAPAERNDFSYDSSDNASTYNSTTANGSDSSSSYSSESSSSSYSSYDSGSSSSSSSSSSDSGSSGGGGGE